MIQFSPATALVSGACFYVAYYFSFYGRKPVLFKKKDTKWDKFLQTHVSTLTSTYWSLFWLPGGRFQTILSAVLPRNCNINYRRENVETPDGGQFTLAWTNERKEQKFPIAFVYPGLVSTTQTNYVQMLTKALVDKNYTVVVMVNRGLELPCLTGKAFCATHTADLEQAITLIKSRYEESPIVSIGISLGGLVMSRYLAIKGVNSGISAAFLYSCPFNPVQGSASIEKWDYWFLYNISLTKGLKEIYLKSKEKFVGLVDHDKIMGAKSIREIDTHFTSKVFGYETVDHYYEDAVITPKFFNSIKTPTLCLCADDDAFVPYNSIPGEDIAQTDYVALAVTSGGGHVGHLGGLNPYSTPYYVEMFLDYANASFKHVEELPKSSD